MCALVTGVQTCALPICYGELEAAPQIICRLQPEARALAFAIGLAEDDNLPKVAAEAVAEGTAVVVRHQGIDIVAVFGGFSGALPSRVLDLEFDGDALWLALSGAPCPPLAPLGLRTLARANPALPTGPAPRRASVCPPPTPTAAP